MTSFESVMQEGKLCNKDVHSRKDTRNYEITKITLRLAIRASREARWTAGSTQRRTAVFQSVAWYMSNVQLLLRVRLLLGWFGLVQTQV
jgi:hypothetical protein